MESHDDRLELLRRSAVLGRLSDAALVRILPFLTKRDFAAGDVIFERGEEGRSMLMVVSGVVKIRSYSLDGRELILNQMVRGEVFGELALLDGEPRSGDAVAVEDTQVLVLDRRDFLPFLAESGDVAADVIRLLCRRIRDTTELAEDAVFEELPHKLLRRIEIWADQLGVPQSNGILVKHGLTQREIGETIGMVRESVNKQLGTWRASGFLETGRGYILIRDLPGLRSSIDDLS